MRRVGILLIAMAALAAGCGGDDGIEISDPWARASANMQNAGAVYLTIHGGSEADVLTGVSVSSDVAGVAEVHETTMGDDGAMAMHQVAGIDVPADGEVRLEPGGYHVMLMQLSEPLEAGAEFDVTLTFENAGDVEVTATVRES